MAVVMVVVIADDPWPTYLPTYLCACLPAYMHVSLPAYQEVDSSLKLQGVVERVKSADCRREE